MRIGFDIQTLATNERRRGIGKLCVATINALLEYAPQHEYVLFGLTDQPPEEALPLLERGAGYEKLQLSCPPSEHLRLGCAAPYLWETPAAAHLDLYHVTSPMMDDILIPSSAPCPVVATLLDAIPAVMHERRQPLLNGQSWERYKTRARILARWDGYAAISQTTAEDCERCFGLDPQRIFVTYVPVDQDPLRDVTNAQKAFVQRKYQLAQGFVLSITGYHPRKNIPTTMAAYALLEPALRQQAPLVIVCALNDHERQELLALAEKHKIRQDVRLLGYVPDEELPALFALAGVMFFPSRYEGFGLPVAEAMAAGVPVVASNVSSIPEVTGNAALLCHPDDTRGFAQALRNVLSNPTRAQDLRARGFLECSRFGAERFAQRLLRAYEHILSSECGIRKSETAPTHERTSATISVESPRRLRIAIFTPLSPKMSGIADYAEQLLLNFSERVDGHCFTENYVPTHPVVTKRFSCSPHWNFLREHKQQPFDVFFYQLGNNLLHAYMLPYIDRFPGVVDLHDYSIWGLYRLLARSYGERRAVQERFAQEYPHASAKVWENEAELSAVDLLDYPMTKLIVKRSKLTIVHSEWLRTHLRDEVGSSAQIERVPLGVDTGRVMAPRPSPADLRRKYHLPHSAFVIASVGVMNRLKRLPVVLEAFRELRRINPHAYLVFVGPADRLVLRSLVQLAAQWGVKHCVRVLGHRPLHEMFEVIAMADVCVNLRNPTMGESSATLVQILAMGKPVLVTPLGQFTEFPDDVCWKVRPDRHEKADLVNYWTFLSQHPEIAMQLGENAKRFVAEWGYANIASQIEELLFSVADSMRLHA